MGPPKSEAIIAPRIKPRTREEVPDIDVSQPCSADITQARGAPSSRYMTAPAMREVTSGVITTGIMDPSQRGSFSVPSP